MPLPARQILERRLSLALDNAATDSVHVLARNHNIYSSTFPTEVVSCSIGDAPPTQFFCKHFLPEILFSKSIAPLYEIDVYRHLLKDVPLSKPCFYGAWSDDDTGEGLLVIEDLSELTPIIELSNPDAALETSATWLGRFHAYAAADTTRGDLKFLRRLDAKFFRERASGLTDADTLGRVLRVIDDSPSTVIHAEFYPQNILAGGDRICPVDWETASIGLGEIDLATLLEGRSPGWPAPLIEKCIDAYMQARGGDGNRHELLQRLTAARLLVHVYWLSYGPEYTRENAGRSVETEWRLSQLSELTERIGAS